MKKKLKNLSYKFSKDKSFYLIFKSLSDYILSVLLVVLLSPIFIILIFLVFLNFGFPILFTQERPGFKNKIFKIYKFRSMKNIFDENGKLVPDRLRLNKFGNWLRSTSLDELPEIINIIRGDMSFVGPRPLLVEYLKYYNKEEIKRHLVKPGITGLAQINGRNAISWEERFKYDIKYIEHLSLLLDLKILFKTIFKVISKRDINAKGQATMYPFKR